MRKLKSKVFFICVLALWLVGVTASPVLATDVVAGSDLYLTAGPPDGSPGPTHLDLGGAPLPAGVFGPGSDPFDGVIYLKGNPFSVPGPTGFEEADTIVERQTDAILPDEHASEDTVDTQIIALNLVSTAPITVTFDGGGAGSAEYDVQMCLSGVMAQPPGSMTIRHLYPGGGQYDIYMPVIPKLIFTKVSGVPGVGQVTMDPAPQLDFTFTDDYWSHVDPGFGIFRTDGGWADHDCDNGTPLVDFSASTPCPDGFFPTIRIRIVVKVGGTAPDTTYSKRYPTLLDEGPPSAGVCHAYAEYDTAADFDLDGLHDLADNCAEDYNPFQEDSDDDTVGDICDNCPMDYNPDQSDYDNDGTGDICDSQIDDTSLIPAGVDCWVTTEPTYVVFGSVGLPEIPADFFFPGSLPFTGVVEMKGSPPEPLLCGDVDTQIARDEALFLPPYPSTEPNVPIELISLNLVSVAPMTVTDGGPIRSFDMHMTLGAVSPGDMDITQTEGGGGGVFGTIDDVYIEVIANFEYVNVDDPMDTYSQQVTLYASYIGAHAWAEEPMKEGWPCVDNGFYPGGQEALVLQYADGAGQHSLVAPQRERAYLSIDSEDEWSEVYPGSAAGPRIRGMTESEWADYEDHLGGGEIGDEEEGESYPDGEFLPPDSLYVYEGDPCTPSESEPNDAGLVMVWGQAAQLEEPNDYSSGWRYIWPADPDLRNAIIKVTIMPPSACNITAVSFALVDGSNLRRSWWWKTPNTIAHDVPTTITIDPSIRARAATSPQANGYVSSGGFNLGDVRFMDADENFQYTFGLIPSPAPGQGMPTGFWNYWSNLAVLPKPPRPPSKYYVKWSQRPVLFDPDDANQPPVFNGWNDESNYYNPPIVADDWRCTDDRAVTDVHWWGSFLWWTQPYPPPVVPQAFHIGIWTDEPNDPLDPTDFSHPKYLIWENYCDNWVWNFAGYDWLQGLDTSLPKETCFQINQLLSEDEWFYQKSEDKWFGPGDPNRVYWLSIAAIYDPCQPPPQYPWGWKTRPHYYNDDAVRITAVDYPPFDWPFGIVPPNWPPRPGATWLSGGPIEYPAGVSWDMAFELTTNEGKASDLNGDGIVDFLDFAIFANHWLDP